MGINVIDAFFVTFGLDASDYRKGEREVRDSFKKTRESAKSTFDDIEERGANAAQMFRGLRNEVAGLVLVFAGAKGVTDFAANMLTGEANASRFGDTLGMSTSRVIAWEKAIQGVGGSAGDADAALQSMQKSMFDYRLLGQYNPGFAAFGVTSRELDPDKNNPEDVLMKLAAGRNKFSAQEYARRLQMLGLPQSMIYFLEQGTRAVKAQVDEQERHARVTERDADAAKKLQAELNDLKTRIEGGARPAVTGLVEQMLALDNKFDLANKAVPIFEGVLGAAAITAGIAYWPFFALAGVLAMVAKGFDGSAESAKKWAESRRFWDQLRSGDFKGAANTFLQGVDEDLGTNLSSPRRDSLHSGRNTGLAVPGAGQTGGTKILHALLNAGFSDAQARGILAGVQAEGGGPSAVNPTSGAFGIGQWLGSRKAELFKRYGTSPTLDQQIQFLLWELKGGDAGGASVRSQSDADSTMVAYLRDFMRPQGKNWEHAQDLTRDISRGRGYLRSGGIHIGTVSIKASGGDGRQIANDFVDELRRRRIVAHADGGVAP